jgi:heterodisulfide reductase subunit C
MTDNISRETIDNDAIDPEFLDKVVDAGADRLRTCIQCGTCSSVCPSGRRTAFRTRELIRKALLGLKDDVLSSPDLWLCATCLTCLERCPRQIKVTDAIIIMRNMAVEAGYMLPQHRSASQKLIETGHAVPIDDANRAIRKDLNLQDPPPTAQFNEKSLNDVKEIMKRTGFVELIKEKKEES